MRRGPRHEAFRGQAARRSRGGIVNPWKITEKATTPNVAIKISARYGSDGGKDSANASPSAPRSPPHHKTFCALRGMDQRDLMNKRHSG